MKSRSIGGLAADAAATTAGGAIGTDGAGDWERAGSGESAMDGDETGRADGAVAAGTGVGCTAGGADAGWTSDPGGSDPAADDPTADDPTVGDPRADDPSADDPSADDPSADDDVVGANDEDGICGGDVGATAAGGDANVGTTIPGGGAATANGSSINSTGSSGSSSWNGEEPGVAVGVAADV